ncbi:MAG: hypothetical protein JO089_05890 [Alphaproteobacteria bacterium]|nr:hypothetical protein [Alphaproteobacteria bacterium]
MTERGEIRVAHTGAIQEEAAEEAMQRSNIEERQRTRLVNKIGTDSVMQQELVPALEAYANAKDGGDIEGMKRAIDTVLNAVVGAVQRAQRPGRGGPT